VLVIEDNRENMELMVYLLEAAGHTVFQAFDGAAGLELAGREVPDLVLSDVRMPVMDGYEVARRLKSDPGLRTIPVVAVTASASGAHRSEALAAGFDEFIVKPIDPEAFLRHLPVLLALHENGGCAEPGPGCP
jgi:two-component system cell cycle response regulator